MSVITGRRLGGESEGDLETLARALFLDYGHLSRVDLAQTLDTYSHVLPGMDGGIGDAMDDALG